MLLSAVVHPSLEGHFLILRTSGRLRGEDDRGEPLRRLCTQPTWKGWPELAPRGRILVDARSCLQFPGGASRVAQMVKHQLAMRETQGLGWEDPLEEEMATHSSTLA